jgi:hypothetical protein
MQSERGAALHSVFRRTLMLTVPVLLLGSCTSDEQKTMAKVAGAYVRVVPEGPARDAELVALGSADRHVLTLAADGTFSTEHSTPSLQQFDVPRANGTYRVVDPVTIVLRFAEQDTPDDQPVPDTQRFLVSGDTLYPQPSERMRAGQAVTGLSAHVGERTFLVRQH